MGKHIITTSSKGQEVYVNLTSPTVGVHLGRNPHILRIIEEMIVGAKLNGEVVSIEHDTGRLIGNTDIVTTTAEDTIFYAKPQRKDYFLRVAKNRHPIPSRQLTVKLKRDNDHNYEVTDAWIGPNAPPFPGEERATSDSREYWQTHALVQDSQNVQSKTITKDCPYEK